MVYTQIFQRFKGKTTFMATACVGKYINTEITTQQTRHINPMVVQCWASVVDGGPALDHHWVDVSCLLGIIYSIQYNKYLAVLSLLHRIAGVHNRSQLPGF